ncbi:MAG: amidohydrolase family protein [Chloroflexota bacterium]
MIVDFHNHFFPKPYLDALREDDTNAKVTENGEGETIIVVKGDYSIIVEEHHNAAARAAALDAAGVDMQCLTTTVPGVHSETVANGIRLAQIANDGMAEVMASHADRFVALATLPLQDPQASVEELERSVTQGRLRGGILYSHINGEQLDNQIFWPLYEKASELGVPLFIHPIVPVNIGPLGDYRLVAISGFLFETSVAVSRLIFSGVLARFPNLQLIAAHLGGNLPYLAERMDAGYRVYPESRANISEPPSHFLKRIYMDTFPHSPRAIEFAAEFAGADKILMGSDYPHQIGDLPGGVTTIRETNLSAADQALILGKNAAALLGIA